MAMVAPLVGAALGHYAATQVAWAVAANYAISTATFGAIVAGGTAAGALAASALFPPRMPGVEGPRLGDNLSQISTYGASIPILYGSMALAGNVIWSSGIREHRTSRKQGGGGKGGGGGGSTVTEYSYSASFAVGICEGPVGDLCRVWLDADLVYDAGDEDAAAANAAFMQRVAWYPGGPWQMPDPTIEAHVGAGQAPAYRGLAYLVFTDLPIDRYGNRIPNVRVEVAGPAWCADMPGQRYDAVAPTVLDGVYLVADNRRGSTAQDFPIVTRRNIIGDRTHFGCGKIVTAVRAVVLATGDGAPTVRTVTPVVDTGMLGFVDWSGWPELGATGTWHTLEHAFSHGGPVIGGPATILLRLPPGAAMLITCARTIIEEVACAPDPDPCEFPQLALPPWSSLTYDQGGGIQVTPAVCPYYGSNCVANAPVGKWEMFYGSDGIYIESLILEIKFTVLNPGDGQVRFYVTGSRYAHHFTLDISGYAPGYVWDGFMTTGVSGFHSSVEPSFYTPHFSVSVGDGVSIRITCAHVDSTCVLY